MFPFLRWAGLALLCQTGALAQAVPPSDLLLLHGHIYTGDPAHLWVEAVAVRGDRIAAVGTSAEMEALAGPRTTTIDLHGRMAMPGINDAHDHVGGAPFGVEVPFPPKDGPRGPVPDPTIAELAAAIDAAAQKAPAGQWLQAQVGQTVIRNAAEARKALDLAAGQHPVALEAWWGHGVVLNRRGLQVLGIGDAVKDPEGGHYVRDDSGHLTGLLEEEAGNEVRRRLTDQAGVPASIASFRAYTERRLQQGVTSVQVMATNQRLSYLEQTFTAPGAPLRIRIMRFPMPGEDARAREVLRTGEEVLTPRVRVAGVKYVLDGTPIEELAYQTHDYPDRPGWRGRPDYPVAFLERQLRLALSGRDQLMLHVVGDAMTDQLLDEMEKLAPPEQWRPLRLRIEHGDGLNTPERLARAQKLGIVVAQPRPGRPWKPLQAAAIPLAYGSDGGMAPWFMFGIMTDPKNPQAISREDALAVLTSGPAFAEFAESRKGRLVPGMLADIAVLSDDVIQTPPAALPSVHSVLTIIGGELAYRSVDFHD